MAPKNVLLMVADDLGLQLGCYGDRVVKTPHLDKLAAEGIRFTKGFAGTASCSCSRSTLYTGMHVHQNGQYGLTNNRHHFTTFDKIESAPALLNKTGYLTAVVGKVHVGPDHVYPWESREEDDTRDVAYIADRASNVFDKSKEQGRPFYLTVAFIDPHRDRTRSGFGNDNKFDARVVKVEYDPADIQVPEYLSDLPGTRQELASYYQSISRMDQGVGMILGNLQKAGLSEETLVIFVSDNGPPFINSKTTLYDAGVNLPLIVRNPSHSSAAGITNPNMISWVDILPTILDYTGATSSIKHNPERFGRSILPILSSTSLQSGWDKVFGSHTFHEITNYWPTRFVRTTKYKYHRNMAWRLDFPFAADIYGSLSWEDIRNAAADPTTKQKMIGKRPLKDYFFRPPEELYDLENDPYEVRNLAGETEYKNVLKELGGDMELWQRRTEDPWLYKDGVSVWLVKHHLQAGLKIPDRQDIDVERPETKVPDVKIYEYKGVGPEVV